MELELKGRGDTAGVRDGNEFLAVIAIFPRPLGMIVGRIRARDMNLTTSTSIYKH
jgi:hypothetical protein